MSQSAKKSKTRLKTERSTVSATTRMVLWARAAGRCQYSGCNASLIGDLISRNEDGNFGFVAHIVAADPNGPRGDSGRSPLLADDPANVMLLCHPHHKLIDVEDEAGHPEARLLEMKAAHEARVRITTDITDEKASHVLRYGAKIGHNESPVTFGRVAPAMLPERFPADGRSIGIELLGNVLQDGEDAFWRTEPDNLRRYFERHVLPRIMERDIKHLSVFALAPIPLLIELGRLLCDIVPADVYQLHREPAGWRWAKDGPRIDYQVARPTRTNGPVALKLAVSATITNDRIASVLGPDASIWSICVTEPHNDVMRHPEDLRQYRQLLRRLYNDIKATHGAEAVVHVFPAIPVSVAIETGRVWMPKADLPLIVYDEAPGSGFVERLRIASAVPDDSTATMGGSTYRSESL